MNKKSAGKVFRYFLITLVSLLGIALTLPAAVGLYVRYMPYTLPEPTGKAPDVTAFIPDEASPIPLEEQRQLWVAQQYLYDHKGLYHNPQEGVRILDDLAEVGSDAAAMQAIGALMSQTHACGEKIAGIYQMQSTLLWYRANLLPLTDAWLRRTYRHWQRLKTLDADKAQAILGLFSEQYCLTSSPAYTSTFGKHRQNIQPY